jgi:hypothetical protein
MTSFSSCWPGGRLGSLSGLVMVMLRLLPVPLGIFAAGADGAGVPDPGSDGEIPDEPALVRDGEMPRPPLEPDDGADGCGRLGCGRLGCGRLGCGRLGVICSCARMTSGVT